MTNEDIIKEFNKLHNDESWKASEPDWSFLRKKGDVLCFKDFDFDGWRNYMFKRGQIEAERAINASYDEHAEFDDDKGAWYIDWESEENREHPCKY